MNLIGAMLIMLSCTAAGLMKARSLSELDKTYGTLIAMLTLIKNEIVTLSAPLDEAFERAAGLANGDVGRFMSQVRRDFEKLGEDSFCGIWCSAARDDLQSLSERALSAVEELGASLGRYDSTMQCTAIDRCINEISLEQQTLRLSLSSNKRMYIGIGGATGRDFAVRSIISVLVRSLRRCWCARPHDLSIRLRQNLQPGKGKAACGRV